MNPTPPNRRTIIGVGVLLCLFVGFGIFIYTTRQANTNQGDYTDKDSGATLSSPSGKTPEVYGTPSDEPLYVGFEALLQYGVTQSQLSATKTAFYTYSKSLAEPASQISVTTKRITSENSGGEDDTQNPSLTFPVVINSKTTLTARLEYFAVTQIKLTLSNSSGTVFTYSSPSN